MIYNLSKFARRIFAVTLLLLATGVFGLSVVNPLYVHLSDIRGNIDQERMLLGRLNAIVGDQTGANDIEKLSKAEEDSSLFLQGESEAIKLASLQSRLSEIVSANGVKLRSARNLPSKERHDLHLLGIQLQFSAPIEKLQVILLAIEEQTPVLLVESLQITPLAISNEEERGNLDTRLDVFGVGSTRKNS
jgi:general secretion pathway protein M